MFCVKTFESDFRNSDWSDSFGGKFSELSLEWGFVFGCKNIVGVLWWDPFLYEVVKKGVVVGFCVCVLSAGAEVILIEDAVEGIGVYGVFLVDLSECEVEGVVVVLELYGVDVVM